LVYYPVHLEKCNLCQHVVNFSILLNYKQRQKGGGTYYATFEPRYTSSKDMQSTAMVPLPVIDDLIEMA